MAEKGSASASAGGRETLRLWAKVERLSAASASAAYEPVNRPVVVPEAAKVILTMLTKAAERGDECPSNAVLAVSIGADSTGTPARHVALLEALGVIGVQRYSARRVITILSTGKSTAPVSGEALVFTAGRKRKPKLDDQAALEVFAEALAETGSIRTAARQAEIGDKRASAFYRQMVAALGRQAAA